MFQIVYLFNSKFFWGSFFIISFSYRSYSLSILIHQGYFHQVREGTHHLHPRFKENLGQWQNVDMGKFCSDACNIHGFDFVYNQFGFKLHLDIVFRADTTTGHWVQA